MRKIMVLGGSCGGHIAVRIARLGDYELGDIEVRKFPDGETYIRLVSNVADKDVVYVNSIAKDVNDLLIETLFTLETLKELGAKKVYAVIPYFPYARQDERFNPGEVVSFNVVARMLERAGIDEVWTIDLHLHRVGDISKLFKIPARNLTAVKELCAYMKEIYRLEKPFIIGPDEEAEQWARVASEYFDSEYDVLEKQRLSAEEVVVKPKHIRDFKGRDVLIIDDIISTGGTIVEAVKVIKNMNAGDIYVAVTHALLVKNALTKILKAGVKDVVSTDTVLSPTSRVTVAPLIARELSKIGE